MTRDDIIRMAREAKLLPQWLELCPKDEKALERFFHAAYAAGAATVWAAGWTFFELFQKHHATVGDLLHDVHLLRNWRHGWHLL